MNHMRPLTIGAALGLALCVAGCIDLTKKAAFHEDGSARVELEIGMSAEIAALLSNPDLAKQLNASGETFNPLAECGKPWPSDEPLPEGVRSVESRRGKREGTETCTIVFDVSEPVAAVASANEIDVPNAEMAPRQDVALTALPGGSGYRLRMSMAPAEHEGLPPEAAKAAAAMVEAMFVNRHFTLSLSGKRIENTNGTRAADGRSVSWRFPLADLVSPSPDRPTSIEADIIYR